MSGRPPPGPPPGECSCAVSWRQALGQDLQTRGGIHYIPRETQAVQLQENNGRLWVTGAWEHIPADSQRRTEVQAAGPTGPDLSLPHATLAQWVRLKRLLAPPIILLHMETVKNSRPSSLTTHRGHPHYPRHDIPASSTSAHTFSGGMRGQPEPATDDPRTRACGEEAGLGPSEAFWRVASKTASPSRGSRQIRSG